MTCNFTTVVFIFPQPEKANQLDKKIKIAKIRNNTFCKSASAKEVCKNFCNDILVLNFKGYKKVFGTFQGQFLPKSISNEGQGFEYVIRFNDNSWMCELFDILYFYGCNCNVKY